MRNKRNIKFLFVFLFSIILGSVFACVGSDLSTDEPAPTDSTSLFPSNDNWFMESSTDPWPSFQMLVEGNNTGILYYNLNLFNIDSEELLDLNEQEQILMSLFLKCTLYSIQAVHEDDLTASVEISFPCMEQLMTEVITDTLRKQQLYDAEALKSIAIDELCTRLPFTNETKATTLELKILKDDYTNSYNFSPDCGMEHFIRENFSSPYSELMNIEYISKQRADIPLQLDGITSINDIPSEITYLPAASAGNDSIFIAEHSMSITECNGRTFTNVFSIDLDYDGSDEIICISAEYGLIIFKNGLPYAISMPNAWRTQWGNTFDDISGFGDLTPIHIMIIDSNIDDHKVELIICTRNNEAGDYCGEYYAFSYDPEVGLIGRKLLEYGPTQPYLGISCKGNHLAIETLVNVMGFRYMQINAKLTEDLTLDYYSDGKLLYKHTIDTITHTGMPSYTESKAVLAVELECYKLDESGFEEKRVKLPAGSVLTPVRATISLSLDGGGIGYARPIRPLEIPADAAYPTAEDYAKHQRTGKIMFRDEYGVAYMVDVEITAHPSIDLHETNLKGQFESGTCFYPESIYIGGIEQNVLFKNLDYSAYLEYMLNEPSDWIE